MNRKRILFASLFLFALPLLSGCTLLSAAPETTSVPAVTQLDLRSSGLTDADLNAYSSEASLLSLDLRGNSLSPDAVRALQAALPNCDILWSVPLGSARFDSDSAQVTLPADMPLSDLNRLAFFPALARVDATALTDAAAVRAAAEKLPDVEFLWNIDAFGQTYPSGTTELDLTQAMIGDGAALTETLAAFPHLAKVDLTGQTLSDEIMLALKEAMPDTAFIWSVDLFGVPVSSADTEADISGKQIGDLDLLKQKLSLLPGLTQLIMCNCGPTNEEMETLIAAYPNVKFVWMIRVGAWEMRTDVKAFSKGNRRTFDGGKFVGGKTNFTSEDLEPLKYCTDLIALDVGHGHITDLSILQYLPKLRFLIVAINKISSIEDLKYCPDLEYLEIFQNTISDWSPLLSLPKLTHLNCSTNVSTDENGDKHYPDYTVLKQMPQLQRIWIIRCNLSKDQIADLRAALPNAVINTFGGHSTDNGWRDNDLYREMQGLFNLPILD